MMGWLRKLFGPRETTPLPKLIRPPLDAMQRSADSLREAANSGNGPRMRQALLVGAEQLENARDLAADQFELIKIFSDAD